MVGRASLALFAAVTVVAATVPGAAHGADGAREASAPERLRILVVNDDGVKAPGLDALVEALRRLPTTGLSVVAPAQDRSGTGDRLTPDATVVRARRSATRSGYAAVAVDGFPADAVRWALGGGLPERPDVVVSGINVGANLGRAVSSGTVGAARTAARHGIPALAVSQGAVGGEADYAAAVPFVVEWLEGRRARLLARRGEPPPDLVPVDNLNVPTCTAGSVRGLVRVPAADRRPGSVDCTTPRRHPADDVDAFEHGLASRSRSRSTAVCTRFAPVSGSPPRLEDAALDEVSGVVASRAHAGVLWVHNDSGGAAALSAVSPAGADLGTYRLDGAANRDWEDVAIGPGPEPGRTYLYVGDIGDNRSSRADVVVYRVPEPDDPPDGDGGVLAGVERIVLRYPDGAVDAEALLVDPRDGDLYVIDKRFTDATAHAYRAPRHQLADGADVVMQRVGAFSLPDGDDAPITVVLPATTVTGADVSPDGSLVLVRTYRRVLAFARPAGGPLHAAFTVDPCTAAQVDERQGEAVAFTADGGAYVTIGEDEHAAIHRFETR